MNKICIFAGDHMYEALKNSYENAIPFNEALINGINKFKLFSNDFINERIEILNTSKKEYFDKLNKFYDFTNNIKDYKEINLFFGDDAFCKANLITILAYLENIEYNNKIIFHLMNEKDNKVIKSYNVVLGVFSDLYNKINNLASKEEYLNKLDILLYMDTYHLFDELYKEVNEYVNNKFENREYSRNIFRHESNEFETSYSLSKAESRCSKVRRENYEDNLSLDADCMSSSCYPFDEDDFIDNLDSSWQESLFKLIDKKGYKDPEVYHRAQISKQTFSKIRSDKYYQPNKDSAIQLCIGLKLNIDETIDLLAKAGYTLSKSLKRDLVVRYFIEHCIYNILDLNVVLNEMQLKLFPIN